MRCGNCGHDNPEGNRFCGMCGHAVAVKPAAQAEYAVTRMPAKEISLSSENRVERPAELKWEPVERRQEPVEVREPEPVAAEPARRSDKWWVDEGETTVGGPSFLGLSSSTGSGSGGYSYLFQEEEERSHKAGWVLLVVLLVLGGVVYAKWQPLRDYVLTTAISNSRPKQPAQTENNADAPPPASNAPTTTLASSDTQAPPITTENNADQKKAGEPKTSDSKEGLPERDKESADNSNVGAKGAGKDEKRQAAVKDEAPADTDETPAADEEKPSAAKQGVGAPANEGGELVNSGERYLYGRGVARSCDQAVSYFNAAAAKQNPQAFSHLGALYATGQCVPMDRAVAYAWFRRAYTKEPGNHYFEQNLTMLWREMTPGERQRATGRP